jgi:hypothetical protein
MSGGGTGGGGGEAGRERGAGRRRRARAQGSARTAGERKVVPFAEVSARARKRIPSGGEERKEGRCKAGQRGGTHTRERGGNGVRSGVLPAPAPAAAPAAAPVDIRPAHKRRERAKGLHQHARARARGGGARGERPRGGLRRQRAPQRPPTPARKGRHHLRRGARRDGHLP